MLDNLFSKNLVRVIVADDSDIVRGVFSAIIENGLSADCRSVRGLDEALKMASDTLVDLVLLDYRMPGMDGLNGLKRIMSTDARHVALLSAGMPNDIVEEAIALGASGFLPKTLPPRAMIEAVGAMCLGEKFTAQHFLNRLI